MDVGQNIFPAPESGASGQTFPFAINMVQAVVIEPNTEQRVS